MKHVAPAITLAVIVLLTLSSLSPAAQARPTPTSLTSVLISPLCSTPTQPSSVAVTNFQARGSTEFITGVIVGLALTLVCVGVLRWLMGRADG
jgi:curli biogenesis system outer membrane secretion channel CsgG